MHRVHSFIIILQEQDGVIGPHGPLVHLLVAKESEAGNEIVWQELYPGGQSQF